MAEEDRKAVLAELYAQNRQGLFTLALAITRSPGSAEDAIHDAFVRLCRHELTHISDAKAYVFAAVRNAARDLMTRRRTEQLPLDLFDERPDPAAAALSADARQAVRNAIEELEPQQRETVIMKVYGELTFEQIAAVTGEPLQTVASRHRRALLKIKTLIGETAGR